MVCVPPPSSALQYHFPFAGASAVNDDGGVDMDSGRPGREPAAFGQAAIAGEHQFLEVRASRAHPVSRFRGVIKNINKTYLDC
jgi:hypothetical protein